MMAKVARDKERRKARRDMERQRKEVYRDSARKMDTVFVCCGGT